MCNLFVLTASLFMYMVSVAAVHYDARYILCIDGGASKTNMQILDSHYRRCAFQKHAQSVFEYNGGPSNIHTVGLAGIKNVIANLFEGVFLDGVSLAECAHDCCVVGGFAGASQREHQEAIADLIGAYGFSSVHVNHDAGILLDCIEGNAILLIAGTGSFCIARTDHNTMRIGGLGHLLGDEGSGFDIGKQAIKASLEMAYGYGAATDLSALIGNHFHLETIRHIINPLYEGTITHADVARLVPFVFRLYDYDPVAHAIIDRASDQLACMLRTAIDRLNIEQATVWLAGGLFHNHDNFLSSVIQKADLASWPVHNISSGNPIVAVLQNRRHHERSEIYQITTTLMNC